MSIHRFKYLFQQFVNKTGTSEEIAEFLTMMKRDDYNKEVQDLLDEFWNEPSSITLMGEENAERIFKQIMANASVEEKVKESRFNKTWYKAIAAILIIGLSVFLHEISSPVPEIRTVKVTKTEPQKPEIPGRRFINLPDGSSVILNENSRIELSENFISNGKREVYLYGEAYFDIKHDASHPFIVHTGKIKTTVLGTAFNIKANAGSNLITVTVTRGKVKVGDDVNTYNVIVPDEQVVFDQSHSNHVKKPINAESVIEWINEDLYFDDVSIKDVANQLQERFDVKLVFLNEQIKTCKFSATFLKTQSLEQILNIIGEFNQIKYQFKGTSTVLLDGVGCQ
jgi:ferric-dicitrate binding protein FerR (iron transport regulator)